MPTLVVGLELPLCLKNWRKQLFLGSHPQLCYVCLFLPLISMIRSPFCLNSLNSAPSNASLFMSKIDDVLTSQSQ